MKKITFGTPEKLVPTKFCKKLSYAESDIKYNSNDIKFRETARGCVLEIPLKDGEEVFGFGLQLKGFNHKNHHRLRLVSNADPISYTGDTHAPVPFFVTNKGYGIYFDTARYIEIYCGIKRRDGAENSHTGKLVDSVEDLYGGETVEGETYMSVTIPGAKGVDIYVFEGETITDVVSEYNMFSGGGCDVPEWGLGVIYRAYTKSTEEDVKRIAKYLRDNDIPCDIMGLEPGWQTKAYPCSYVWDDVRFPNYKELMKYLRDNNFHINLWQHAFVHETSPIAEEISKYCGDINVWGGLVPDYSIEQARKIFSEYTKKQLVDVGVDGFKLDECDGSDYTGHWTFPNCSEFPSGLDGEQYHQLFGVFYMQAVLEALGETKTLSEVRNAGALCASYPFVLYSDLYDLGDFVRGVVNSGFSGLLWTPEVRDAKTKKEFVRRLQANVFSVQCLINAWYCEDIPWVEHGCEDEVRELLKVRKKLIPMLKKAFEEYKNTGKAPVRALVSDYTNDAQTYNIDDEYIFCDKLIVAPIVSFEENTRRVYLPEGNWVDYWTRQPVESGWFDVETENIPVYEKA